MYESSAPLWCPWCRCWCTLQRSGAAQCQSVLGAHQRSATTTTMTRCLSCPLVLIPHLVLILSLSLVLNVSKYCRCRSLYLSLTCICLGLVASSDYVEEPRHHTGLVTRVLAGYDDYPRTRHPLGKCDLF